MKKYILLIMSVICLSACSGAGQYALSTYQAKQAYERVHNRHDVLVEEFSKYKHRFTEPEKRQLRDSLNRLNIIREDMRELKSSEETAEKVLEASKVLEHYDNAKDAYRKLILVLEPHLKTMPLHLRLEAESQILDLKQLDSHVQILLSKPNGEDYSGALKAILKMVGVAAKIALAAA